MISRIFALVFVLAGLVSVSMAHAGPADCGSTSCSGDAGASALGLVPMRLSDPRLFECNSENGVVTCLLPYNKDISVTINPDKGQALVGRADVLNVKDQLKSAIKKNERSRILLCLQPAPINFLKGIVLTTDVYQNKVILIRPDDGKEPDLLFPPEESDSTSLSDRQLCNKSFK